MSKLILWVAEKKSLAEAVAKVLPGQPEFSWDQKGLTHNRVGENYFVWLDGHAFLQAMPDHYLPDNVPINGKGNKIWRDSDLPIIPKKWILFPNEKKQRRLDKLAELLKTCDQVIHLGDADEEGQVLVDEALEFYGYKTSQAKRVLVNDYNQTKVREALANIRDNSESLFRGWYKWGVARARYDWLFGLNGTRAYTLRARSLGFEGVLKLGSVKTPLLHMVRERDRIIEEFKPIPYFTLSAQLQHANGGFKANWRAKDEQLGLDESGRLIDAGVAEKLVQRLTGKPAEISGYTKKAKQTKAPLPLAVDELQMDAFRKFGYDGQTVLDAAQKLYETYKVTSYPRSTNRYLSEAQHAEAANVMAAVFKVRSDLNSLASLLDVSRKSDSFSDKEMAGQVHHGIVPAIPEVPVNVATWSEVERNLYDMIVRSYLAQFAAPYEYMATSIEVNIDGEQFTARGNTPVAQGWKAIYAEAEDSDKSADDGDEKQTLPAMQSGDTVRCDKVGTQKKKTSPPPRFDDALLVDAMKNIYKYVTDDESRKKLKDGDGIGTGATRGPMILDIKESQLLVPLKAGSSKLMTSPSARALLDALPLDVKNPARAGIFKVALDRVAKSTDPEAFNAFMSETEAWVKNIVEMARVASMTFADAPGVPCPKCDTGRLKRKNGSKGWFWSCSRWNAEPKCQASFNDVDGKPQMVAPKVETIQCPVCKAGSMVRKKRKDGGFFWGCHTYPGCKSTANDKDGKIVLKAISPS